MPDYYKNNTWICIGDKCKVLNIKIVYNNMNDKLLEHFKCPVCDIKMKSTKDLKFVSV